MIGKGKRIISVLCGAMLAFGTIGLASCNKAITAYEIAVKNGFQGTEEQWLESLHGDNGNDGADFDIYDAYENAKAKDGFEGSFEEFLKQYLSVSISEDNDTKAIANATSSIVSICAGFTTTKVEKDGLYKTTTIVPSGSEGSGVVYKIDQDKNIVYIITNYHVIYGKDTDTENCISECIYVYPYGALKGFTTEYRPDGTFSDNVGNGVLDKGEQMGDVYGGGIKARYVGGAMEYDIAVLEVALDDCKDKNPTITAADILSSDLLTVGEKTFAIGNANGDGIAVTSGILSVESEYIKMTSPDATRAIRYRVMRTDAAINHGNSGGGLFNANGKLIGITNAKNVKDETDNMGYALPITQVKYVVDNILDHKASLGVLRATLGIQTQIKSSSGKIVDGKYVIEEEFQITDYAIPNTAAAYGKLFAGDVIQTIKIVDKDGNVKTDTTSLKRSYQLVDLCLTVRKGDKVTLGIKGKNDVVIEFNKDEYFVKYE